MLLFASEAQAGGVAVAVLGAAEGAVAEERFGGEGWFQAAEFGVGGGCLVVEGEVAEGGEEGFVGGDEVAVHAQGGAADTDGFFVVALQQAERDQGAVAEEVDAGRAELFVAGDAGSGLRQVSEQQAVAGGEVPGERQVRVHGGGAPQQADGLFGLLIED